MPNSEALNTTISFWNESSRVEDIKGGRYGIMTPLDYIFILLSYTV